MDARSRWGQASKQAFSQVASLVTLELLDASSHSFRRRKGRDSWAAEVLALHRRPSLRARAVPRAAQLQFMLDGRLRLILLRTLVAPRAARLQLVLAGRCRQIPLPDVSQFAQVLHRAAGPLGEAVVCSARRLSL